MKRLLFTLVAVAFMASAMAQGMQSVPRTITTLQMPATGTTFPFKVTKDQHVFLRDSLMCYVLDTTFTTAQSMATVFSSGKYHAWRYAPEWMQMGETSAASTDSIPFQRNASRQVTFLRNTSDKVAIGSTATPDSTLKITGGLNVTRGLKTGYDATINGVTVGKGKSASVYNTRIGNSSFVSPNYAEYNTAVGYNTMNKITNGSNNTAVGKDALYSNTSGDHNTAIGYGSLYFFDLTSAGNNTAVGSGCMYGATTGIYNTSIGSYALSAYPLTGRSNTTIGYNSMKSTTSGFSNTAVGVSALYSNTTGYKNIALGDSAGYSYTTLSNRMYLGARDSTTTGIFFNRTTGVNKGYWNGKLNVKTVPYSAAATLKVLAQDTTTGDVYRTTVSSGSTYTATSPVDVTGSVISIKTDTLTSWHTKQNQGATAYGWGNHASAGYMTNPMTTNGDIIYQHGGVPTRVPIGTLGQYLKVNPDDGNGLTLGWGTVSGGGSSVTAANASFTTTSNRKAVYISGAASTDKYVVTPVCTVPLPGDLCGYEAKTDSLIIHRANGAIGTSGLTVTYYRLP